MLYICSAFGGISPDVPLEGNVYVHADLLMTAEGHSNRQEEASWNLWDGEWHEGKCGRET